jgi:3-isopropylmalate dehydrogenase
MEKAEGTMVRIAVIPGDGVGPEVVDEALHLLRWARDRGRPLEWEVLPFGADHFLRSGETLPAGAFESLRDGSDAILFGAVGDPRIPDHRHAEEILLRLRQGLQLRVNLRPCRPIADALVPLKGVRPDDVWIEVFRENTEGPYCLRGRTEKGMALDEAVHTEEAVACLLEAAFRRARQTGRPLLVAHKANVLKHGHGLWLRVLAETSRAYPQVQAQGMHADALLCALVKDPRRFAVIAADNFVGDLISDLLAAFQGGMGMAASASTAPHRPYRCSGLFEPVHGSAPDIAGLDRANPCGMVLSTALMFRHLEWDAEAEAVERAVAGTVKSGEGTPDIGGRLGTRAMGEAIRQRL